MTTTGPDATHPPNYLSKLAGGGGGGGGARGGRIQGPGPATPPPPMPVESIAVITADQNDHP